jgi:hypothetical protein
VSDEITHKADCTTIIFKVSRCSGQRQCWQSAWTHDAGS